MDSRLTKKLLSITLVLNVLTILGCSKEPLDYTQPHEYIEVHGFTIDDVNSTENKAMGYDAGYLVRRVGNFFEVGSGKCMKYLNSLSDERIKINMEVYNSYLWEHGGAGDRPIAYATFQCKKAEALDVECKNKLDTTARETLSRYDAMTVLMYSKKWCTPTSPIGEVREIRLR